MRGGKFRPCSSERLYVSGVANSEHMEVEGLVYFMRRQNVVALEMDSGASTCKVVSV